MVKALTLGRAREITHRNNFRIAGNEVSTRHMTGSVICTFHVQIEFHRTVGTELFTSTVLSGETTYLSQHRTVGTELLTSTVLSREKTYLSQQVHALTRRIIFFYSFLSKHKRLEVM